MAKRSSQKVSLNYAIKLGTEVLVLNAVNQAVNSMPNLPPAVKAAIGIGNVFATYEITKKGVQLLPPGIARSIGKSLATAGEAILVAQQIPNIIAIFSPVAA